MSDGVALYKQLSEMKNARDAADHEVQELNYMIKDLEGQIDRHKSDYGNLVLVLETERQEHSDLIHRLQSEIATHKAEFHVEVHVMINHIERMLSSMKNSLKNCENSMPDV